MTDHCPVRTLVRLALAVVVAATPLAAQGSSCGWATAGSCPDGPFTHCYCPIRAEDPAAPNGREDVFYYAPPEVAAAGVPKADDPYHWLSVFLPRSTPPPGGWPVILVTHAPNFVAPAASCGENLGSYEHGPARGLCDQFQPVWRELVRGNNIPFPWAVVCTGVVGWNSEPLPSNIDYGYEPDASGQTPWEDFGVFWAEKDLVWARQWIAANQAEFGFDDERVVAWGESASAVYAAFVAGGAKRVFRTAWSAQAKRDTRCAGLVAFDLPAWFPTFVDDWDGRHWPDVNDPAQPAYYYGDAVPGSSEAVSASRVVREPGAYSTCTPMYLVYDEPVTIDDLARHVEQPFPPGIREGDPIASNWIRPPSTTGPLHPAWSGFVLYEDLGQVNAEFHIEHSRFVASARIQPIPPHFPDAVNVYFPGPTSDLRWAPDFTEWLGRFDPAQDWPFARAVPRLGSATNPVEYHSLKTPVTGADTTWEFGIASEEENASLALVFYSQRASATPVPNAFGEGLVQLGADLLEVQVVPLSGGSGSATNDLTAHLAAVGEVIYTQAIVFSPGLRYLNGIDLHLYPH